MYKVFKKQREREETSGQSCTVNKFWFLTNTLNDLESLCAQQCISWGEFPQECTLLTHWFA